MPPWSLAASSQCDNILFIWSLFICICKASNAAGFYSRLWIACEFSSADYHLANNGNECNNSTALLTKVASPHRPLAGQIPKSTRPMSLILAHNWLLHFYSVFKLADAPTKYVGSEQKPGINQRRRGLNGNCHMVTNLSGNRENWIFFREVCG